MGGIVSKLYSDFENENFKCGEEICGGQPSQKSNLATEIGFKVSNSKSHPSLWLPNSVL